MFGSSWQSSSQGASQASALVQESLTTSPVDRVPPEVLGLIFALVSEDTPRTRTQRFTEYNLASWYGISILGVCRRWRAIAFSAPQFWSRLPLSSPLWAKTALERSKAASLVLDTSTGFDYGGLRKDVDTLKAALQEMSRMREVVLHWSVLTDKSSRNIVLGAIQGSRAPLLERLVIESMSSPGDITLFLNEPAPRLHYLSLDTFPILSSSPLLRSNLQTLKLKNCGAVWDSVEDMVQALTYMPDLEHLELLNAFPAVIDPTRFPILDAASQRTMASLKTLKIEDSSRRVASILRHLSIPAECTVDIVTRVGDSEPEDSIPKLRDAVEHLFASALEFTRVDVMDHSSHRLSFDAWLAAGASTESPAHLAITFEWSPTSMFGSRLTLLARSGFPLPYMRSIRDVKMPAHILAWDDMLPGFFVPLQLADGVTVFNPFKQNPGELDKYSFVRREAAFAAARLPAQYMRIFPACRKLVLRYLGKDGLAVRTGSPGTFLDFLGDVVVNPAHLMDTRVEDVDGHWAEADKAMVRQRFVPRRRFVADSWSRLSNILTDIGVANAASALKTRFEPSRSASELASYAMPSPPALCA